MTASRGLTFISSHILLEAKPLWIYSWGKRCPQVHLQTGDQLAVPAKRSFCLWKPEASLPCRSETRPLKICSEAVKHFNVGKMIQWNVLMSSVHHQPRRGYKPPPLAAQARHGSGKRSRTLRFRSFIVCTICILDVNLKVGFCDLLSTLLSHSAHNSRFLSNVIKLFWQVSRLVLLVRIPTLS